MRIRPVRPDDAAAVAAIYNHYVEHTIVTFEERALSAAAIRERIATVAATYPYLVAETRAGVAGFAYASRWHERCSYRLSVETTVYLAAASVGTGLGTEIYSRLLDALERGGYHCAIGGIALPNDASVALHEKLGFERVAHFREVGRKFERWIDVGYWQRFLGRGARA